MNHKILKKIAKSERWQLVYNRVKEIGTLKLFSNIEDLSEVQLWFLHYLTMFDNLYQDLARDEKYISEEVIADDIRCDAYLLYRRLERNKDKNKGNKEVTTNGTVPSVVFKRK